MTTSNSVNLKEEIYAILLCRDWRLMPMTATKNILDIFNAWLRDQDARNSDGDPLRLDL